MENPVPAPPTEGKEDNKKESFLVWAFFTLFLPMIPVLLKILLHFFGKQDGTRVNILDSTELLYYSFIISIVILYSFLEKKKKRIVEGLIAFASFNVAWISIVMIVMVYLDYQHGQWIRWASIIVTVLMIIAACINQLKKEGE